MKNLKNRINQLTYKNSFKCQLKNAISKTRFKRRISYTIDKEDQKVVHIET